MTKIRLNCGECLSNIEIDNERIDVITTTYTNKSDIEHYQYGCSCPECNNITLKGAVKRTIDLLQAAGCTTLYIEKEYPEGVPTGMIENKEFDNFGQTILDIEGFLTNPPI